MVPPPIVSIVRSCCRIRDHMAARGPDGAGEWQSQDGRVIFGHRRLAIIDLSENGAQPMQSADRKIVITFNGEIYNYRTLRTELEAQGCRLSHAVGHRGLAPPLCGDRSGDGKPTSRDVRFRNLGSQKSTDCFSRVILTGLSHFTIQMRTALFDLARKSRRSSPAVAYRVIQNRQAGSAFISLAASRNHSRAIVRFASFPRVRRFGSMPRASERKSDISAFQKYSETPKSTVEI